MSAQNRRGQRAAVTALATVAATLLVACGSGNDSSGIPLQPAPAGTEAPDFTQLRPGDRVTAFLGKSTPPSQMAATINAAQDAIDACIANSGGVAAERPPLEIPEYRELQTTDPALFRARYGYGVIETERYATDIASRESPIPDGASLGAEGAQCVNAGDAAYRAVLPPVELTERYNSLLMTAAEDPAFSVASDSWAECMVSKGIEGTVTSVYFAKGFVDDALLSAEDPVDFGALQAYEIEVFNADAQCLGTSGAGVVMLAIEDEILSTLRADFPEYQPLGHDPSGQNFD